MDKVFLGGYDIDQFFYRRLNRNREEIMCKKITYRWSLNTFCNSFSKIL